jgi:hypothetical protein
MIKKSSMALMTAVVLSSVALATPSFAKDVTETYDLEGFDAIKFDGFGNLNVTIGEDFKISATGDDDMVEGLRFRVRGSTLVIDYDDHDDNIHIGSLSDLEVDIDITMPSLNDLEIDGLVDVVVEGLDEDRFKLEVDGKVDVELVGKCISAEIEIDGWADLRARNFKCESVTIEFDGMGDADVYASESIDASADGMADIDVYGNPKKIRKDEDGWADVTIRKK